MKFTCRVLLLLLVISLVSTKVDAASRGTKKIYIGIGLMVFGVAVTADAVQKSLCFFGDCPSHDVQAVAGLGMVGVGTVLLIMGLREHGRAESSEFKESLRTGPELLIGAGPIPHGFAGGVTLRW